MRTRRSALHAIAIVVGAATAGCLDGDAPDATADGDPADADGANSRPEPDGEPTDDGAAGDGGQRDDGDTDAGESEGRSGSDDPDDEERPSRDGPYTEPVRIDEPPYSIERPDGSDGDWNPLYRCENAPDGPSVPFEQQDGLVTLADGIGPDRVGDAEQYYVALIDDESDLDRLDAAGPTAEFVEETDLSESALVAIQSGWASSSVSHHVGRVEPTESGLRVHACYTAPREKRDDAVVRSTLLRVERTDSVDRVRVSLVVADDRRVHFNSTEGVVTIAG